MKVFRIITTVMLAGLILTGCDNGGGSTVSVPAELRGEWFNYDGESGKPYTKIAFSDNQMVLFTSDDGETYTPEESVKVISAGDGNITFNTGSDHYSLINGVLKFDVIIDLDFYKSPEEAKKAFTDGTDPGTDPEPKPEIPADLRGPWYHYEGDSTTGTYTKIVFDNDDLTMAEYSGFDEASLTLQQTTDVSVSDGTVTKNDTEYSYSVSTEDVLTFDEKSYCRTAGAAKKAVTGETDPEPEPGEMPDQLAGSWFRKFGVQYEKITFRKSDSAMQEYSGSGESSLALDDETTVSVSGGTVTKNGTGYPWSVDDGVLTYDDKTWYSTFTLARGTPDKLTGDWFSYESHRYQKITFTEDEPKIVEYYSGYSADYDFTIFKEYLCSVSDDKVMIHKSYGDTEGSWSMEEDGILTYDNKNYYRTAEQARGTPDELTGDWFSYGYSGYGKITFAKDEPKIIEYVSSSSETGMTVSGEYFCSVSDKMVTVHKSYDSKYSWSMEDTDSYDNDSWKILTYRGKKYYQTIALAEGIPDELAGDWFTYNRSGRYGKITFSDTSYGNKPTITRYSGSRDETNFTVAKENICYVTDDKIMFRSGGLDSYGSYSIDGDTLTFNRDTYYRSTVQAKAEEEIIGDWYYYDDIPWAVDEGSKITFNNDSTLSIYKRKADLNGTRYERIASGTWSVRNTYRYPPSVKIVLNITGRTNDMEMTYPWDGSYEKLAFDEDDAYNDFYGTGRYYFPTEAIARQNDPTP